MTHFARCFLVLLLLSQVFSGFAQNKDVIFKSKISENDTVVGINELVKVEFIGNVDFDSISTLPFSDFQVISGPTSAIFTDAVTKEFLAKKNTSSFFKSYYYILKPKRIGDLTIRSETMQFENKQYETPPNRIIVTDSVEEVNFITRGMKTAKEEIHLVADIVHSLEVKDTFSVIYKLYFPHTIGLQRFGFIDMPEYKKLNALDIEVTDYSPIEKVYKANNYRSIVLKKFTFPSKNAKRLVVEPLSIELFFEVPTDKIDDFGTRIYEYLYFNLVSKAG